MANRTFNQFQGSLEKGVVQLYAEIAFGASGAASLVVGTVNGGCKGIASATKTGTGVYDVVLQDTYIRTLGLASTWKGTVASAGLVVQLTTDSVSNATTPKVTLTVYDEAGVATEPASGEALLLSLTLSNSTAL
jgi:hypothetical protein